MKAKDTSQVQVHEVSSSIHDLFRYVMDMWITSVLSYVGAVGNIMTILVFAKMGFQNTINISLFSIAVWDLMKCLCNIVIRIYGPIQLVSPTDAQNWQTITSLIFGYLNTFAGYISGILAAYVAIERCLCISLPFTVKFLLTRNVVTFTNIFVPFLVFGLHGVAFSILGYSYVFSPKYNDSVAVISYKPNFYKYPAIDVYTSIISTLSPMFSFTVMAVCTVIISYFLRRASKVRATITKETSRNEDETSSPRQLSARDRQVIKMLLIVIGVYIVTYIPKIAMYIATLMVSGFRPSGRYGNLKWIAIYIMFMFDTINAMANPFIFYFMSSSFKGAFMDMFCSKWKTT